MITVSKQNLVGIYERFAQSFILAESDGTKDIF